MGPIYCPQVADTLRSSLGGSWILRRHEMVAQRPIAVWEWCQVVCKCCGHFFVQLALVVNRFVLQQTMVLQHQLVDAMNLGT